MITLCLYLMTLPINYSKTTLIFLLNLILIILFTITLLTFIIALNLYNTGKKSYVTLYDSILDILLELFDYPLHADEGISIGVEDLEPSADPESYEGDPEGEHEDPDRNPEGEPDGDPEGDPEDDPEKKDKKRKRSEDSEDDSEEESNKQKKGKLDKGKGRADPNYISDDDYDKYDYRDVKNPDDEQSSYDYQNTDEDDDNAYLAESLDRRDELEKKLEGASPEEKEQILNEIEVLTDFINNLLN